MALALYFSFGDNFFPRLTSFALLTPFGSCFMLLLFAPYSRPSGAHALAIARAIRSSVRYSVRYNYYSHSVVDNKTIIVLLLAWEIIHRIAIPNRHRPKVLPVQTTFLSKVRAMSCSRL